MTGKGLRQIDWSIARCRLVLSVTALIAVFIDPTAPMFSRWIPITSGLFLIDPNALAVLAAHFCYSVTVVYVLGRGRVPAPRLATITTWVDVLFGAAVAMFTEGATSPFYAFFAFAVMEAGLMNGLRRALLITGASVGLYLALLLVSAAGNANLYIMRPVYLAITGYLVGYLGQQRLNLEAGICELAAESQRHRIARDLHDGRAQALAGITLRLESCQELRRRGRHTEALLDLSELQGSVNREYDELRAYMRSLAGVEATTPPSRRSRREPLLSIGAHFNAPADLVEHVLQILREGVANVRRHAQTDSASIRVRDTGFEVLIAIDDDGVGFRDPAQEPWSISSRVMELGGTMDVVRNGKPGAHLAISIPQRRA
jgi:signal transduction histidine kinase